jgi:hypothetical protein
MTSSTGPSSFRVRRSPVHGTGVFAVRPIAKGERISEYYGERISHAEADRRYAHKAEDDNHTFLFTVSSRVVIDGGVGDCPARFINHGCDPNCETLIEKGRVFIEAVRPIKAGEELSYDYMIERDVSDAPNIDVIYACRCGAEKCRGSMLLPKKKPKKKSTKKTGSKAQVKAKAKTKTKAKAKAKAKAKKTAAKTSLNSGANAVTKAATKSTRVQRSKIAKRR